MSVWGLLTVFGAVIGGLNDALLWGALFGFGLGFFASFVVGAMQKPSKIAECDPVKTMLSCGYTLKYP